MRMVVLSLAFLPFAYYAARDQAFHLKGRRVSLSENLLHIAIGITIVGMVKGVLLEETTVMLVGLATFLATGALDEYVYHRDIPGEESDLHAKEHFALFAWLGFSWLYDAVGGPTGLKALLAQHGAA